MTISGGVAEASPDEDIEAFLKRTDEALYAAKKNGRNATFLHDGRQCVANDAADDATPVEPDGKPDDKASARRDFTPITPVDARVDALTGLPNRLAFAEAIRSRLAACRETKTPLALALFDVDGLDKINRNYGAPIGDISLRAVAQVLRTARRKNDLAARYEAGTFVMMLEGSTLETAVAMADCARKAIGLCKLRASGMQLSLTVCAGVSELLPDDDGVALVKRAAAALRHAKNAGANNTVFSDGEAYLAAAESAVR